MYKYQDTPLSIYPLSLSHKYQYTPLYIYKYKDTPLSIYKYQHIPLYKCDTLTINYNLKTNVQGILFQWVLYIQTIPKDN